MLDKRTFISALRDPIGPSFFSSAKTYDFCPASSQFLYSYPKNPGFLSWEREAHSRVRSLYIKVFIHTLSYIRKGAVFVRKLLFSIKEKKKRKGREEEEGEKQCSSSTSRGGSL